MKRRHEAAGQVQALLAGAPVGGCVSRLRYLGEEAYAVALITRALEEGLALEQLRNVAAAVALLEEKRAENLLRTFVAEADAAVRMSGVEGLGRLRSKGALPLLVPLLEDGSFGVRREVARALERIGSKGAGRALVAAASAEGEPEVRVLMLSAAGASGEKAIVPSLLRFRESSSEATRLAALRALCRLGAPEGISAARELLASDEVWKRRQGIALLEGASLGDSTPLLEPLLTGNDAGLAAVAGRTLHENGDSRMLPWLILSSAKQSGEERLVFERELERLRVTDEQRAAILRRAEKTK